MSGIEKLRCRFNMEVCCATQRRVASRSSRASPRRPHRNGSAEVRATTYEDCDVAVDARIEIAKGKFGVTGDATEGDCARSREAPGPAR
jgi:hypothetical protein